MHCKSFSIDTQEAEKRGGGVFSDKEKENIDWFFSDELHHKQAPTVDDCRDNLDNFGNPKGRTAKDIKDHIKYRIKRQMM